MTFRPNSRYEETIFFFNFTFSQKFPLEKFSFINNDINYGILDECFGKNLHEFIMTKREKKMRYKHCLCGILSLNLNTNIEKILKYVCFLLYYI